MMQAAQPWRGDNFADRIRSFRRHTSFRSFFVQAEMRSVLTAITSVLKHKLLQMAFIDHNHVVDQVAA
jgi:hypothetical protein